MPSVLRWQQISSVQSSDKVRIDKRRLNSSLCIFKNGIAMETTSMSIEFLAAPLALLFSFVLISVLFNLFCVHDIIDNANSDSARATALFIARAVHEVVFSALIFATPSYEFFFLHISLSLIFFWAPIVVFFLRNRKSKRSNGR